jgi:hypothetical protein
MITTVDTKKVKSNIENLELYSDNYPFSLPLRISAFENESEYNKFIKNCEMLVRRCIEYRQWKNYIIDVLGVNTCMVTDERMDQCSIEIHHHLPSLYVLVKTLINKKLDNEQEFSTFDIAQDVIELHFKNKIGYITVIKSMHEKFHNGYLYIPIQYIKGDYQYFIREFSGYIDDEDMDIINMRLSINESNCNWSRDNYKDIVNE